MTKTMKRLMILALLTVVSVGLKAQETNGEEPQVTAEEPVQVKVDISEPFTGGEVKCGRDTHGDTRGGLLHHEAGSCRGGNLHAAPKARGRDACRW